MPSNLHAPQPVFTAGAPLAQAPAAMLMLHGRGASAHDILSLAAELGRPDLAYIAPQAYQSTWYPNRFLAPIASNEPWLGYAFAKIEAVLAQIAAAGLPPERTFLLGFSQGASLSLEYLARHPRRYAGVFGLSGAMLENGDQPRDYTGTLAGTPVFLGCSDVDPHIPKDRVERTAQRLAGLGAEVTLRLYPNMDHTVNGDELRFIRALLDQVVPVP